MSRSATSIKKNNGGSGAEQVKKALTAEELQEENALKPGELTLGKALSPEETPKEIKKKEFKKYIKYTLIFFGLMAALYLFSMYGTMLSSPGFTYAEF